MAPPRPYHCAVARILRCRWIFGEECRMRQAAHHRCSDVGRSPSTEGVDILFSPLMESPGHRSRDPWDRVSHLQKSVIDVPACHVQNSVGGVFAEYLTTSKTNPQPNVAT